MTLSWSLDDYMARRCEYEQLGKPRPAYLQAVAQVDSPPVGTSATPDVAQLPLSLLREEAARSAVLGLLEAVADAGGWRAWWGTRSHEQGRAVVQLLKETPAPSGPATVTVNLSWLSPDRLAYRRGGEVVSEAPQEALEGPTSAQPPQEAPEHTRDDAWKPQRPPSPRDSWQV